MPYTLLCATCNKPEVFLNHSSSGLTLSCQDSVFVLDTTFHQVTSFLYDFGDGSTSTSPNPVHTYASPGQYNVCLNVTNQCGTNSVCFVVDHCANANFTLPVYACLGDSVQLTNLSPALDSVIWLDSLGVFSHDTHAVWLPAWPDTQLITLVTWNGLCWDTLSKPIIVQAGPPNPVFTLTKNGSQIVTHNLTTQSQSTHWDFGDGGTSNSYNATHSYTSSGIFPVCLTSTNACGSQTVCDTFPCQFPTVDFNLVVHHDTVILSNFSLNGLSFLWDFGDGTVDSVNWSPVHVYGQTGGFDVCLTVQSSCNSVTLCKIAGSILPASQQIPYFAAKPKFKYDFISPVLDGGSMVARKSGNTIFASRQDPFGNEIWTKGFVVNNGFAIQDMITLNSGEFIIVGSMWYKTYLLKFDQNANPIWWKAYESADFFSYLEYPGYRLKEALNGDLIMVAQETNPPGYPLGQHIYLARLNAQGDFIWGKRFQSGKWSDFPEIDISMDGQYIALCSHYNFGAGQVLAAKLDMQGNILFSKRINFPLVTSGSQATRFDARDGILRGIKFDSGGSLFFLIDRVYKNVSLGSYNSPANNPVRGGFLGILTPNWVYDQGNFFTVGDNTFLCDISVLGLTQTVTGQFAIAGNTLGTRFGNSSYAHSGFFMNAWLTYATLLDADTLLDASYTTDYGVTALGQTGTTWKQFKISAYLDSPLFLNYYPCNGLARVSVSSQPLYTSTYPYMSITNFTYPTSVDSLALVTSPVSLASANSPQTLTCAYACNGPFPLTASVSVSGNTATFSGNTLAVATQTFWKMGNIILPQFTQTFSLNLPCGTYSACRYAFGNCEWDSAWVNFTISGPTPAFTLDRDTICPGDSILLTNTSPAGGDYTWSIPDLNILDSTHASLIPVATGAFTVSLISNCNGFADTTTQAVWVASPAAVPNLGPDTSYCDGQIIPLDPGNFALPPDYLWQDSSTNSSLSVNNSGQYWVNLTDSLGCQARDTVNLTFNPNPVINLGPDTSACLNALTLNGGNNPAFKHFLWCSGDTTQVITPTISGMHCVTVWDSNGCSGADSIQVILNPLPLPNLGPDQNVCQGNTTTLNPGTFPSGYLFNWQNGAITPTLLAASGGLYWVNVTDSLGCKGHDTLMVNSLPNPVVNLGPDTLVCSPSLLLDAGAGNLTYLWCSSQTTQTLLVSNSGNYCVTVQDQNGCQGQDSIQVTLQTPPTPNLGPDLAFCDGNQATLNPGNFPPGFSFLWQNNTTGSTLTTGNAGTFWVQVTDPLGCSGEDTLVINVFPNPIVNLGPNILVCNSSLTLNAGSGPGITSYLWCSGQTTQSILVSSSGNYCVTVQDQNGCQDQDSIQVTLQMPPTPNLGPDLAFCDGNQATLNPGNFPPGFSYLWQNNTTGSTLTTGNAGTFWVQVTDNWGCTGADSLLISLLPHPPLDLGPDQQICDGDSLLLAPLNPTFPYTSYLWQNGSTNSSLWVNTSGQFSLEVWDNNGCQNSDSVSITLLPTPAIQFTPPGPIWFCPGDSALLSTLSSYPSYLWSTGATTSSIWLHSPGLYSLTVSNAFGCTATQSLPADTFSTQKPVISLNGNTLISTTLLGYTWQLNGSPIPGATSSSYTPTLPGSYTVTGLDANNCWVTSAPFIWPVVGTDPGPDWSGLEVFPNPSRGLITIRLGSPARQGLKFRLSDPRGRILLQGNLDFQGGNTSILDLGHLSSGAYLLELGHATQIKVIPLLLHK
ncbi:MAG: PKD domain-containing protein [Bacteroidia bacterium]|nr:PKD domain-containing protein [Bacteroidia bacterium]